MDDFAFRKGTSYGTLICDLTTGHPIAMLPSRKKEDVTAWLNEHPSVKLVSRDGSHTYQKAISDADYLIVQVMDRFHLVKKLHEHMTDALKRIFPSCWLIPVEKSQPLPLPSTPELEQS
ncbi:transposase [Schinkia azotoformans]|nr:transposase [Schinkia azotoformans]